MKSEAFFIGSVGLKTSWIFLILRMISALSIVAHPLPRLRLTGVVVNLRFALIAKRIVPRTLALM